MPTRAVPGVRAARTPLVFRPGARDPPGVSLTFGLNLFHGMDAADDAARFADVVRRADEVGVGVLGAPDHLGASAPFAVLVAAGALCARMRMRSYVLNAAFWNPALLAREVATADQLTGGRIELGIGAGHMRAEFDDAGIPWRPHAERTRVVEATLAEVRRRLDDPDHRPRPVQRPVPVLVGAMSDAGLDLAARHADVVGISGARQVRGEAPGTFTLASAAETDRRVAGVRAAAGGRPYRTDLMLQAVVLGRDPRDAAAEFGRGRIDVEVLLDSPFALFARDAGEAADELERRRVRYGLDEVTVHQPSLEAWGEVIAAYRARR